MDFKKTLKKIWHFIWEEDSLASWIVNIIIAFILIKFIVYPGLGFALGTTHPVVAVVSSSMEHDGSFEEWWNSNADCGYECTQGQLYESYSITKEEFKEYVFKNGFNKGDIMVLVKPKDVEVGDVVVFWSGKKDPIIHRIVFIENGLYQTKGDHNVKSISTLQLNEYDIKEEDLVGKALFRIPLLGYVKIWFVELLKLMRLA